MYVGCGLSTFLFAFVSLLISLVGPKETIRQRLAAWEDSAVTGLLVWPKTTEDIGKFAELVLG